MATRFYLTNVEYQNVAGLPGNQTGFPAIDASWETTFTSWHLWMTPTKIGTRFTTALGAPVTTANNDVMLAMFVSDPLAAQTITGTVKSIVRASEQTTNMDARAQLLIKVVSINHATVRGTLLSHNASALSNEFATSLTNRKFPLNWSGAGTALGSVAAQAGDRLVVEMGYRTHSGFIQNVGMEFGDASATDLAENETGTTQDNPWIEFSQTLVFEDQFTGRHGRDTKLITQLGHRDQGPAQSRGESYVLSGFTFEETSQATIRSASTGKRTQPSGSETPVRGYGRDDDFTTPEGQDGITVRIPVGGGGFPSGSNVVKKYKMRALLSPGPGYVTWVVSNTPDFAGAQAPAPIQVGSAVVSDLWVEV